MEKIPSGWRRCYKRRLQKKTADGFLKGESSKVSDRIMPRGAHASFCHTAVMTIPQVVMAARNLAPDVPSIISVFAGRIADTGRDACRLMESAAVCLSDNPAVELLWASTREVYNIIQAEEAGCQIVTVPPALFQKLPLLGHDLLELSRETVCQFRDDGLKAGYTL